MDLDKLAKYARVAQAIAIWCIFLILALQLAGVGKSGFAVGDAVSLLKSGRSGFETVPYLGRANNQSGRGFLERSDIGANQQSLVERQSHTGEGFMGDLPASASWPSSDENANFELQLARQLVGEANSQ